MRITPHIHALRLPFFLEFKPGMRLERFVYAYLIVGDDLTLVDAGVAGSERAIFDYIETLGRAPEEIQTLILTHAHPDHMGGAGAVVERTGCAVLCHELAQAWIEDPERQNRERPVPGFFSLVAGPPVTVSRTLAHGQELALPGACTLTALHAPGHSPDQLALWSPIESVLISGDCLPQPGGLPIYENLAQLHASLDLLEALHAQHLLSSWDDPLSDDQVPEAFDQGRKAIARVHEAVMAALADQPNLDTPSLTAQILALLGLPPLPPAAPIVRTIQAHRRRLAARA